ncbi:MAG: sulfotransferase family 2 domain-containing protein [Candidatus Hermodarchaeota archaeon]
MVVISHKHKFIYIKTRKTASTSIQILLGNYCDEYDIMTPIKLVSTEAGKLYNEKAINYKGFESHMSANQVMKKVGKEIWNEYFKFTFERNPWDKVVSYYCHMKAIEKTKKTFEDWLITTEVNPLKQPINYPLYTIRSGLKRRVALDYIGKYESLMEDLEYILQKLNLPLIDLTKEKANFRGENTGYREFYNEKLKEIVETNYKEEIELFDYKF